MRVEGLPYRVGDFEVIEFLFTVNRSFLRTPSHPITILKKYNSILRGHISSDHYEITLHTSNNNTLDGYIYHGVAGWGPYYQIRIPQREYEMIRGHYYLCQVIVVELKISNRSNLILFLKK